MNVVKDKKSELVVYNFFDEKMIDYNEILLKYLFFEDQ
jgi:hypothetical protein